MFTEFIYIALTICLLLCAGKGDHVAYGMSFETLLRAVIAAILLILPREGFCLIQNITYFLILRLNLLNFRSRELPNGASYRLEHSRKCLSRQKIKR